MKKIIVKSITDLTYESGKNTQLLPLFKPKIY